MSNEIYIPYKVDINYEIANLERSGERAPLVPICKGDADVVYVRGEMDEPIVEVLQRAEKLTQFMNEHKFKF